MNHPIIKEFRDFVMRGDIIALAVAFIMAGAFGAVVAAFTDGIVMAFIAAIFGKPSFDSIGLDVGDGRLYIGTFLTALANLLIVAAAVFFFIVKPVKILQDRKKEAGEPVPEAEDVVLLREIRDLLKNR
ncbi:MAG: large conductance mechanosensitive channel protein MscL [Dehalococcoidia bacterium]